ncbi:MAG: hypothetical protein K2L37_07220, partial [Lactobacillus sp.]|nr:hypothetical protein [Lactobacillus sp.]
SKYNGFIMPEQYTTISSVSGITISEGAIVLQNPMTHRTVETGVPYEEFQQYSKEQYDEFIARCKKYIDDFLEKLEKEPIERKWGKKPQYHK